MIATGTSAIGLSLVAIAAALLFGRWRRRAAVVGPNLRLALLSRTLIPPHAPTSGSIDIQATVMDWNVGGGVASVVAYADGAVSLYFDNGGGIIGGGTHASVHDAGIRFFALTSQHASAFTPADTYPLPDKGRVTFWLVHRTRTFSSGPLLVEEVMRPDHPLAAAGNAAQAVITVLREMDATNRGNTA